MFFSQPEIAEFSLITYFSYLFAVTAIADAETNKSCVQILKSAVKYFLLAVVVLVFNTCILKLLIAAGLPYMIAKIFTETVMFFFSWTVQKFLIFKEAKA